MERYVRFWVKVPGNKVYDFRSEIKPLLIIEEENFYEDAGNGYWTFVIKADFDKRIIALEKVVQLKNSKHISEYHRMY